MEMANVSHVNRAEEKVTAISCFASECTLETTLAVRPSGKPFQHCYCLSNPSLLTLRYSARGFSLPCFWSANRMRKALLRPDLLAAKCTASASTRAQASAAFLDDMRVHRLSVSASDGKHDAGRRGVLMRRPRARSMAVPCLAAAVWDGEHGKSLVQKARSQLNNLVI